MLMRIRSQLLKLQRCDEPGLHLEESTINRIRELLALVEHRHEFRQVMLAACVGLKKTFHLVHLGAFLDLLKLLGISATTIDLLTGKYSVSESAVTCGGGTSSSFLMNTGVRHGCVLMPLLFKTCIDWALGSTVGQSHYGASIGNARH